MISPIEEVIAEARAGRMVILVDDESRENEGDLVLPADCVTPDAVNFMATYGRGLICLALDGALCDRLQFQPMVQENTAKNRTAFMVSVEAKEGITTGISAYDRAHTMQRILDAGSTREEFASPGHVFPLRAANGGVFSRMGHTEAAVDLAALAGFQRAGVICEVMRDDGHMARLPDLNIFAARHGLKIGTIADLIGYLRPATQRA